MCVETPKQVKSRMSKHGEKEGKKRERMRHKEGTKGRRKTEIKKERNERAGYTFFSVLG